MSIKSDNVKKLYLEGIRDGNIEVVKKYTGDRYTQHSAGVRDGADGFIEFFEGFLKRTNSRDIQIIRTIEDGNFVFVHAYQDLNNGEAKWVTADLFDTDKDDKIIEHWDTIAPYQDTNSSVNGHDMILGDFEISDLDKTEENKALIRSFLVEVFQNKNLDKIDKYVSADKFIQHSPNIQDGIDTLKQLSESGVYTYDFVFKVIGQGNYAVSYSKVKYNEKDTALFEIFRIENGKLVERWENMETIAPREEWVNTGKF